MKKIYGLIATWLLIAGGLIWGSIGFFQFNPLQSFLGQMTWLLRLIYGAVGISAIYVGWRAIKRA